MANQTRRLDLLVVADGIGGGLGNAATSHARWFAEKGWSVALAAFGAASDLCGPAWPLELPEVRGAFQTKSVVLAAIRLRSLIRRYQPVVVHAHGTRSQLMCLLAGRRPYVSMHGSGGRISGQGLVGTIARQSGRRIAARLAIRAYSAAPASGRWETLLHASPRLAALARTTPPEHGVPRFVWIGRLDAPKQPEKFIQACSLAAQSRPVQGVVVGDGPLLASCRAMARDLRAPVEFLGERSDIAEQLAQARAVCLFSGFEGIPFALQEAMWAGRAVVLSSLPSLTWFAGDVAAFADDPETAARAILDLCDHSLAVARGSAAAERVRELISVDAPFPQLLHDYAARSSSTDR